MPDSVDAKNIVPMHLFVVGEPKVIRIVSTHDVGGEQDGIDLVAVLGLHVPTLTYTAGWLQVNPVTPGKPSKGEMWEIKDDHDGNSFSLGTKVS